MLIASALSRRTWGPPFVAKTDRQLLAQLDVAEQVLRIEFVMDAQDTRDFLRPFAIAVQAIAATYQQAGPDQNSEMTLIVSLGGLTDRRSPAAPLVTFQAA